MSSAEEKSPDGAALCEELQVVVLCVLHAKVAGARLEAWQGVLVGAQAEAHEGARADERDACRARRSGGRRRTARP